MKFTINDRQRILHVIEARECIYSLKEIEKVKALIIE